MKAEKCTKQSVQTAARNAKFLSNQQKAGLFTAGTATENTGRRETTTTEEGIKSLFPLFLFFSAFPKHFESDSDKYQ